MAYAHMFIRRIATVILAALTGLLCYGRAPQPAQHDLGEIREVSVSCNHMDRSYSYYFRLHREEGKWLFDATCFTHDHEQETVFENLEIGEQEIKALFEILERNDSIAYAENYKKPKKSDFVIMDETTYVFCLTFSDGRQYSTYDCQEELEQFFYRLAENILI